MATCKACTHYDVCSNRKEILSSGIRVLDSIDVENICPYFRDRSRFIELPCKIEDVIFCTTMGKIYKGIVGRIELDDEGFAIITTDGYCFDSSICYHTQEEAEQALVERKPADNTD